MNGFAMKRQALQVPGLLLLLLLFGVQLSILQASQKVIIDTDFARPPQDDALAVLLALKSEELDVLGLTTVAGNFSREQATADLLRLLEIADRRDLPVYEGANLPLVHRPSEFDLNNWGEWYSDEAPPVPPGGFASIRPAKESAAEFLVRAVKEQPQQVVLIALGPLTNIAVAISGDAAFSSNVKKLYIMGGAIASLPDGAGNITPNAEFNFWVDPEAAHTVLRSGISIELSPLNVSRKTGFTREHLNQITSIDTPVTQLLKLTMAGSSWTDEARLMYDQVTVASVIDPSLVRKTRIFVDVDRTPGINYGVSVGGEKIWPGAENAQSMWVQYDLDWERFIEFFIKRVASK
jgi:inosine-uridine nucleoside N-ribohydrolase